MYKGFFADYALAKQRPVNFTAVIGNETSFGLNGKINLVTTYSGFNFVNLGIDLSAPAENFGKGSYSMIWF